LIKRIVQIERILDRCSDTCPHFMFLYNKVGKNFCKLYRQTTKEYYCMGEFPEWCKLPKQQGTKDSHYVS